jgi:tetratricopeptide (TPR) repeat protein
MAHADAAPRASRPAGSRAHAASAVARRARDLFAAARVLFVAACVLALGCTDRPVVPGLGVRDEAITLAEVRDQGDDRRRASNHLVEQGLDADDLGDVERAFDRYQLALKVDPGNPWAYLAIARHELDRGDPSRSLAALDRSRALLEREGPISPRVETHLLGLRGVALEALGRFGEARADLEEARHRAPGAWGDGYLTAAELR